MKTLHRLGAVILLIFILAHIGNHVMAAFGFEHYQNYLSTVRLVYRHSVIEPLLILLIMVQAVTGVWLAHASLQRPGRRHFSSSVELISACIFFLFITLHLAAIAVTRFHFETQTDFYWVASLMRDSRFQPFMIGFHFLGVLSVMIHVGYGLKYWFESMGLPAAGGVLARVFIVLGLIAAIVSVAAYSGAFFPISFDIQSISEKV